MKPKNSLYSMYRLYSQGRGNHEVSCPRCPNSAGDSSENQRLPFLQELHFRDACACGGMLKGHDRFTAGVRVNIYFWYAVRGEPTGTVEGRTPLRGGGGGAWVINVESTKASYVVVFALNLQIFVFTHKSGFIITGLLY